MKSPDLVSFFVVMTPVWCLLAYWAWEWMTPRKIPDPKPGDIWRSQYSGRAIRGDGSHQGARARRIRADSTVEREFMKNRSDWISTSAEAYE